MARARRLKAKSLKRISCVGSSGGGRQENSLRTVRSISQVLYTNTGWSVHMFRVGLHRVHRWAPFLFGCPWLGISHLLGLLGLSPNYSKSYNFVDSHASIGCSHRVVQRMCHISVIT